ncbi:hypothetical protein BH10PSE7_BH10PSE7_04560 [soil metagenome]
MTDNTTAQGGRVRRRHVFYMSGYDPKGAAWYYQTFATEAAKQASVSGYSIAVGARTRSGRHIARWPVQYDGEDGQTETVYDFLKWDDIMRRHWPRGDFYLIWVMARTYGRGIANKTLYNVLKTSWPSFIAGAFPAVFIFLLLLKAIAWGWVAALIVHFAIGGWGIAGTIAGLLVAGLTLRYGMRWLERFFGTHWLLRIYAFNQLQARRAVPGLDERLDHFAERIVEAARANDTDEILVIGHSTGAQGAVTVLARALERDPDLARRGPVVSFITLGGSIPMLAWQPEAQWFRDDLKRLGEEKAIPWIDVTTAQDGATFTMCDPLVLAGLADPSRHGERPKLLSTRLFDLLTPQTFKKIRRNWYKVHFQYLMAGERPADYDFFAISAGPRTLEQRFAHRPSRHDFKRFKLRIFR